MKRVSLFTIILLVFILVSAVHAQFDPDLFSGMKARSIGPAGMSGRIGDIEAVVSNPDIIYVGAATGGLWKSVNGGITWKPLFDDQPVSSIGAVSVFQPNPSVVWVGTGEGNPRNSVGVGHGAFKSLDGGETWTYLGLGKTEKIHRIVLHPTDPNIAYAGALGTTWGENPERGVFKTVDGGKTWKKVLYVDEKTGCCDLVMDPSNPNKLFAGMWEHRRWPWFFKSGGPGSGLYVTYDGGENWKKITEKEGLPKGELGKIGIGIARNNPDVVYALTEATKSALCRSDDGGRSWRIVNQSRNVNPRPFYYCDIRVDPENENRLYSLHSRMSVSEDGGRSFRTLRSRVHLDHHAFWIHPEDGSFIIDGNDGGVAISYDRGKTWRFVDNLPLAQFYHINVDMEIPYNIYGGMQDNGSWRGPSDIWENGGIRNYHWDEVGFGDGFATLSDPTDPTMGYCMSQGGRLQRYNNITGERKDIRPWAPDTVKLRFNWNAGIAIDPFDLSTVYYGSQFVHKSTDRGDSWTIISPDLTTNDPEKQKQLESGGLTYDVTNAENHTTILTIAPSKVEEGIIWVGTDDGQVQVTRDGGKTWTNLTRNIPDLAWASCCPHIEASRFDAGSAYAVFEDHQRSNWTTYIYKTENFGRKWVSLARNGPDRVSKSKDAEHWGFVHVIEQDPVDRDLLYLGTEFGLFISFDDGKHWMKWIHGVPTVPVRALIVHPRDNDLVIGTHGRAAYVLDDIHPLRSIDEDMLKKPLHFFEIPATYQHHIRQVDGYHFPADAIYEGESRPYGASITYYVNPPKDEVKKEMKKETGETSGDKREKEKKVAIQILDDTGEVIRKMDGSMDQGINRVFWNLRRDGFKMPTISDRQRRGSSSGPEVLPGKYTIKVKLGEDEVTQDAEILPDPRVGIPLAERREKFDTIMRLGQRIEVVAEAVEKLNKTIEAIDVILERIKEKKDETLKALNESGTKLKKTLQEVNALFMGRTDKQGSYRDPDVVISRISGVSRSLTTSWDKPTQAQMTYLRQAEEALEETLEKFNHVFETDVATFQKRVEEANFDLFPTSEPLSIDWIEKE